MIKVYSFWHSHWPRMEKEAASQRAGARGRVARSVGWALIIQIVSAAGRMLPVKVNHPWRP